MPVLTSKARAAIIATLAVVPVAGAVALAPTAAADTGYHEGTANITVEGETINACPYLSVAGIVSALNDRTGVEVTTADVTTALGTSDLAAFQRSNCRRSNDDRDRPRRPGTTVVDCTDEDNQGRTLDTRYRDARDRYDRFYRDRYERDSSVLNLSVLRGLYNDYLREERGYRDYRQNRDRVVVRCNEGSSSSAAPAPTTVNNYQVVQAPPGSSSGSSGGGVTYRAPRGGAETGQA